MFGRFFDNPFAFGGRLSGFPPGGRTARSDIFAPAQRGPSAGPSTGLLSSLLTGPNFVEHTVIPKPPQFCSAPDRDFAFRTGYMSGKDPKLDGGATVADALIAAIVTIPGDPGKTQCYGLGVKQGVQDSAPAMLTLKK